MTIIAKILRCLCMCIVLQRGSWTPNNNNNNRNNVKNHKSEVNNCNNRKEKLTKEFTKPEWLKQWTISKGWMHNRSHLLGLGRDDDLTTTDNTEVTQPKMQHDNIADNIEEMNYSAMFEEISQNYRSNFPSVLLPVNKENLLKNEIDNTNALLKFVKRTQMQACTDETSTSSHKSKSNLGQNIARFNTLNSKTNLHEDTIYECSEDDVSLYNNPIYEPIYGTKMYREKFEGFHTNHICKKENNFKRNSTILHNNYRKLFQRHKYDTLKYRLKSEKYIIRHIKIRIMLSMRLGKFHRVKRKMNDGYRQLISRNEQFTNSDNKSKLHQEQRKIGNGKTSMKIQNMRFDYFILIAIFIYFYIYSVHVVSIYLISVYLFTVCFNVYSFA